MQTYLSLPDALARHTDAVERELRSIVPDDGSPLYNALRYHMGWCDQSGKAVNGTAGKRFRPVLCLMACASVGGEPDSAMPAAVALELVHNFSLIHDDIQDRDTERHHMPTVWAVWGESQALSAGNAMYTLASGALLKLAEQAVSPDRIAQASASLTRSSLEMMEGQYLDLEFEKRTEVNTDDYLDMIARKTGALIACTMEMGVLIGSGDTATASVFARTGRHLGHLFQVRDDILGVWGEEAATGKPTGSDIRRKKKTYLVVQAMQQATGAAAITLKRIYAKQNPSDQDIRQVMDVMESTCARQEAEALAARLADRALEAIQPAELSPRSMRDFEELVSFLLNRNR